MSLLHKQITSKIIPVQNFKYSTGIKLKTRKLCDILQKKKQKKKQKTTKTDKEI
jgi:hypothetical protein